MAVDVAHLNPQTTRILVPGGHEESATPGSERQPLRAHESTLAARAAELDRRELELATREAELRRVAAALNRSSSAAAPPLPASPPLPAVGAGRDPDARDAEWWAKQLGPRFTAAP